jgi:Integrase core domain
MCAGSSTRSSGQSARTEVARDRTKKKGVDRDWERKGYGAVNLDGADKTKSHSVNEATPAHTARLPHNSPQAQQALLQNGFSQAQQAQQLCNLSQAQQDQLGNLLNQLLKNLNNKGILSSNCVQSSLHSDNCWVIDSGATDHMTGSLDLLQNNSKAHNYRPVIVANGSQVPIDQIGTTNILSNNISGVLYLPNFTSNLLSVSKITKELNCNVIFSPTNVVFQDIVTKRTIGEGKLDNGLYYLDISNKALAANSVEDNKLWHWRISHASDFVLNKLLNLRNLDNSTFDICRFAKQTRLSFTLSNSKTSKNFELVHSDVWGPAPVTSYNNFRYYVTFIDDFSRTTWIYLLTSKDEVFQKFVYFSNFIENQYNTTIKILRSENGTKYVNKTFSKYLHHKGILHQTTYINTPE